MSRRGAASGWLGPVLLIYHDDDAAVARFGVAALTPAQLPVTTDGLRHVFSLARPGSTIELPQRRPKKTPKKETA